MTAIPTAHRPGSCAGCGRISGTVFRKRDVVQVAGLDAACAQAIFHGVFGKGHVVFLAGEPFLLRGGDNLSVAHQARGAVVVKGGEAEDVHFVKLTKRQLFRHAN